MAMFVAINALGILRVSTEGEMQGIDLHEHGIPAYPEYALHSSASAARRYRSSRRGWRTKLPRPSGCVARSGIGELATCLAAIVSPPRASLDYPPAS